MKSLTFFLLMIIGVFYQCHIATTNIEELNNVISQYESFSDSLNVANEGKWPQTDARYFDQSLTFSKSIATQLAAIDPNDLEGSDRINHEMLSFIVGSDIENLQFSAELISLNAEGGFITGLVYYTNSAQTDTDSLLKSYISRIESLPQYIDNRIAQLKRGIDSKKVTNKLITQNCLSLLEMHLEASPEASIFAQPFKSSKEKDEFAPLIKNNVFSALRKLHAFLSEEYLPAAYEQIGLSQIPGGKKYYEKRVAYFTTLEMSPDKVFEKGQDEVKRIRTDMEGIIEELGFEGSFQDFIDFLRTDPQFYPKTPLELLQRASYISKEIEGRMPTLFGKLPRLPFTVKPVPAAIAPKYTGGRYSPGSIKHGRAGQYWVNTYKLDSRPYYVLPALTLHEAVPGHHHQMILAQELEGLPDFRNNYYISAFGEGWGLYSEYLGIEADMYKTPYEKFGRMTYEMWRACRLVVDVGIHYKGWTKEEAVSLMASNTALSLHEVNTEIDRYIGWPAQAVSYKIGELKIRELRALAEDQLGGKFDLKAFHDKILENGSVPLFTLDRIVKAWINNQI